MNNITKNKKHRILSLFLSIALTITMMPMTVFASENTIVASGECGDNLTWELTEDGILTILGSGDMYNYSHSNGVTKAPWGEYRDDISKLILNSDITYIGDNAFRGCKNITGQFELPSKVKGVGSYAFARTGYSGELCVPETVENWGQYVFSECYNFTSLVLPEGMKEIPFGLVDFCNNLTGELIIPTSVTKINGYAFHCTSYSTVILPECITEIGSFAFSGTKLAGTIVIPKSVVSVKSYAFNSCFYLEEISFYNPTCEIYDNSGTIYDSIKINGYLYSTAKEYAYKYNRDFERLLCEEHTYGEWIEDIKATCTEVGLRYKECDVCGDKVEEEIPVLGHNYADTWTVDVEATCSTEGSKSHHCTRCESKRDITSISANGHTYGEWVVKTEVTCTTSGLKYKECECGDTVEEEIPVLGHNYSTEWTIDKAATCTEDGSKSIHCTACNEIKENTIITATGHSWYNDENNIRICRNCGYSENNSDATGISGNRDKLYEKISAESNDGTNSVSFGKLSSNGYNYYFEVNENSFFAQYKTKDSNWTKVISFEYDYNTDTVTSNFTQSRTGNYYAATATFDASDYINVDSIVYKDATGSNYGGMCVTYAENFAATAIPKINQKMMSEFGVSLCKIGFTSYSHTHSGGNATCHSYAECEVCGKVYGSLEEHITEIKNQIYATCYKEGYTGDLVCTVCNEVIEYGQIVPIIEREVSVKTNGGL